MAKKRKSSGTGISIPAGVAIGVFAAIAVMLLGAIAISYLVLSEKVEIENIGILTFGLLAVSSAFGAITADFLTKQKRLLVSGLTALAVFLILLSANIVFFNGEFGKVGLSGLMILIGAGGSLLPMLRKKSGKSKVKIPVYR